MAFTYIPSPDIGVPIFIKPVSKSKSKPVADYSYRTFYISKRNGSKRKICAPSADLLKFQRKTLPSLVSTFITKESNLFKHEVFHGFIPGRNIVTCAKLHQDKSHTITLDISNCFDSISKSMINIPSLDDKLFDSSGHLAQGFATSPILSAIYLCDPMRELVDLVAHIDPSGVVTCYADDIQISLSTQSYDTLNRLIIYATYIFNKYKLTINTKKTRIRHSKFGNRKILGIQVGNTLSPNRKLKKKIRAARFQKNGPSLGGLVTASKMMLPKVRRQS